MNIIVLDKSLHIDAFKNIRCTLAFNSLREMDAMVFDAGVADVAFSVSS